MEVSPSLSLSTSGISPLSIGEGAPSRKSFSKVLLELAEKIQSDPTQKAAESIERKITQGTPISIQEVLSYQHAVNSADLFVELGSKIAESANTLFKKLQGG